MESIMSDTSAIEYNLHGSLPVLNVHVLIKEGTRALHSQLEHYPLLHNIEDTLSQLTKRIHLMSQNLHRIAYASLSTFKPFTTNTGVDVNIAQILQIARQKNQQNRLVGALYYGNGCFFQCLEGEKQDIDALYAKLLRDPRHKDLTILVSESIEKSGFSSWEMKFAAIDHEVRSFLRQHQLAKFDPYKFSSEMSHQLIGMLQQADEALNKTLIDEAAIVNTEKKQTTIYTWISMTFIIFGILLAWYLIRS